MSALTRTQSGPFTIDNSVKTETLTTENINEFIIPTDSVLLLDSIYAQGKTAFKLFNGLSVPCDKAAGVYKIYKDGDGLAEVNKSLLKVRTKLC